MSKVKYPAEFLRRLKSVTGKRPRTIIKHILRYGRITTEELKDAYGYNHPPRTIRDVREQGIPIVTFRVMGKDGRKIAAYEFGAPSEVRTTQLSGRTAFSSNLKKLLAEEYGSRCNIYLEPFPMRELQIDHRIPFEIAGGNKDSLSEDITDYMLLCASANRAKSWSCENCPNWRIKDANTCKSCYWAYPESYTHIAMRDIRRVDLLWSGEETTQYDLIVKEATKLQKRAPEHVKNVLRDHFKRKKNSSLDT
uniref:Helix-turn-helix domain-containing protein n=1 Tax=Candidatus Kentrum sp. TC TaxID=2126339 RepID=A0A450YZ18_9GAMM|nr:MAG: Helix-turn-helix domain-containing protein [Candidatus Kentron sp. TC]